MERFFIQSCSIDEIVQIEELLLRRYSDINYILSMEFDEGIKFILKAFEKELEERLWDRWLVDYRHMDEKNFIDFEKYKNMNLKSSNTKKIEQINKKDIEQKVKEIIDLTL